MTQHKVLFILTSHDHLLDETPTGWYLPEAAHPYCALESYFNIEWASPKGGKAPLDPSSITKYKDDPICARFIQSEKAKQGGYENTKKLSEINPNDYIGLFYVGGHGPCFDLSVDEINIKLAEAIWKQGKILSAICHGPAALDADGTSIFANRRATSFSDEEEILCETTNAIPFLVETRLRELGAKFEKNIKAFGPHVTVDGQFILGANPASAIEFSEKLCEAISKQVHKFST